jgi:hypothetical protein
MAQRRAFVPIAIAAAILGLPEPTLAQAGGARLPVSLDRIRAGLNAPPSQLRIPAWSSAAPTFRVDVHQDYFDPRPIEEEPPLDPTLGLPSVGELVLGGVDKLRSAARGRARRRAKQEVADALAAFCAVHDCPAPPPK